MQAACKEQWSVERFAFDVSERKEGFKYIFNHLRIQNKNRIFSNKKLLCLDLDSQFLVLILARFLML